MGNVTLAFDGDCGLCRWTVGRLRRWDYADALAFVPIQRAGRLLAAVPTDERLDSVHAVTEDGRVFGGGAAVPVILRCLPGGRPLAWAASRAPWLTDRAYRAVADRRRRIGTWLGQDGCPADDVLSIS